MKTPLQIVHLEDNPYDAEIVQIMLETGGLTCVSVRVETREEFTAALERGDINLVIADFSLPNFDGLSALKIVRDKWPDLPFILLSGTVGEELAIDCLKSGATDYVLKERLSRLVPAVRRALSEVEERTARRKAEESRKQYSHKLQVLSRQLVEAQETERRVISRELHDEVGQALTVAQLNLQAVLQAPGIEALVPRLQQSLEMIERVQEQVQDISLNLRPSMLDDLGLEPAVQWYTNRQALLTGLDTEIQTDPLEHRLDPLIETECFRVAQEALTNVARHAQASAVKVELRTEQGNLHLRVRDDGVGFDVAAYRERAMRGGSLGLLSMEERATRAGGGLECISNSEKGTEIHAWFPLKWRTPVSCRYR